METWAPACMGKRVHLPPGNVVKCFVHCSYSLMLSRPIIYALFLQFLECRNGSFSSRGLCFEGDD